MKLLVALLVMMAASAYGASPQPQKQDFMISRAEVGRYGGGLVVAQRAEPKTLNPVTAVDAPSREVIRRMAADLIHINRQTQRTEPALAKSWTASPDGRHYVLRLRRGVRFSDGVPFDADDVVFSFQVYTDEQVHSPQRDLLLVGGRPIAVRKLDAYTVAFDFVQPYAAGDRLFDSVAMLPRHLLEKSYRAGALAQAWSLTTSADQIAGLGPFRLKAYLPGQSIKLERNPYYWKKDLAGQTLPYLSELTFLFVSNDDAQMLRFEAGDTDVISRLSAENYGALADERNRGFQLYDAGPGLEYNFLLFNLNDDVAQSFPEVAYKQKWFRDVRFRQALSAALDRDAVVRLVFQGRGAPLAAHVTPGNKLWIDHQLAPASRSLDRARGLLRSAGFSWRDGKLVDPDGRAVEFVIAVAANNSTRMQMATIIQQDAAELGMQVHVAPLEFRSLVDRVTGSHNYDVAVMGIASGDVDPTAEMNVWMSSGSTHLWNLGEKAPSPWQAELDRLMQRQLVTLDYKQRKRIYDRVQQIVADNLPILPIASPNILVAAKRNLGNFRPSILDHYTLSNCEELYWRSK